MSGRGVREILSGHEKDHGSLSCPVITIAQEAAAAGHSFTTEKRRRYVARHAPALFAWVEAGELTVSRAFQLARARHDGRGAADVVRPRPPDLLR